MADNFISEESLCPYDSSDYGNFFYFSSISALSGFFFTWMMVLVKILQTQPGNERVPNIVAFNIVSMGLVSTLMSVSLNLGGICLDSLGYVKLCILFPLF